MSSMVLCEIYEMHEMHLIQRALKVTALVKMSRNVLFKLFRSHQLQRL